MKVTVTLLVLLTLFALSTNSFTVKWNGNVTSSQITNLDKFTARKSLVLPWVFAKGAHYFSAFLDFERTDTTVDIEADAILGFVSYSALPISTFAYYDGSANFDVSTAASGATDASVNTDENAGYLVSSFLKLEEKNPSGTVVNTMRFSDYTWNADLSSTGSENGLHYLTIKAATNIPFVTNAPADIYVTWAIADNYGIVEVDGVDTFIFPKNLESFIKVENYNYDDPANKLVLTMGGCSGSVSRERKAVVSFTQLDVVSGGSDLNIIYAAEANVDGEAKTVEIKRTFDISASDAFDGEYTNIVGQLDSSWSGNSDCHLTEIVFVAGGAEIKYDPALSQGEVPSSAISMIFSVMFIALIALI